MRLYFTEGCPFAHRARSLLTLLEQPFTPVEVDLANKTPEFLALSPTGAVPLLDDGGFVLFESAVITEYLAEKFSWGDAFSPDVQQRARERLAMKRFEDVIIPLFFQLLKDPSALEKKPNWRREVALVGETMKGRSPRSLLGIHVAPFWLRMQWLAPESPVVAALKEVAGAYLEAAIALPAIVATSPEREKTVRETRAKFGLS